VDGVSVAPVSQVLWACYFDTDTVAFIGMKFIPISRKTNWCL